MGGEGMRRGGAAVHVEFGVRSAIVAGVTMVPLAVRAMLDGCAVAGVDAATRSRIVRRIMGASGAGGMVGGQLLDLLGESRSLSIEELENIHRGKTGALIAAAAEIGGMAAAAARPPLPAFARLCASFGLSFQIMGHLLHLTRPTAAPSKTAGRDTEL